VTALAIGATLTGRCGAEAASPGATEAAPAAARRRAAAQRDRLEALSIFCPLLLQPRQGLRAPACADAAANGGGTTARGLAGRCGRVLGSARADGRGSRINGVRLAEQEGRMG
jgi:hypothetical protein